MRSKIWLVGGGTGGHVVPLIAIAEVLDRHKQIELIFVGDKNGIEGRLAKQAGYKFLHISSGKLRRDNQIASLGRNLLDIFKSGWGFIRAWQLLGRDRPAVMMSKGGPVALPVAVAAWLRGVPIVTHESDAVMGVANRWIAKLAKRVLTAFPATLFPSDLATKIIVVGIPLRQSFLHPRHERKQHRPMVLMSGGSQGAVSVGKILIEILPELLKVADVMHLCGMQGVEDAQLAKATLPADLADRYAFLPFADNIADYIHESTLVITRGSSQMFEIATLGKPMISIPLPWAAQNHQVKNAEYFARAGAAIVIRQESLTPSRLYETIGSLIGDKSLRQSLVEGTRQFDCRKSAEIVADILLTFVP